MTGLEILFWLTVLFILHAYAGYPLMLLVLGRRRPHRVRERDHHPLPFVTLIISAYNEEKVLEAKIRNSLALRYPEDRLEVVVVSDGSTDRTEAIASAWADHGVRLVRCPVRLGKSRALNYTLDDVSSEIVVFSDANSHYEPDALEKLVRPFGDPEVGCVTGRLVYDKGRRGRLVTGGEGLYWRYENLLSRLESRIGSALVATGTLFAIRRDLFPHLDGDVANDFQIPMEISARGYRILYESEAVAHEMACSDSREEFRRKVRIVLRGLVGLTRMPRGLSPLRIFQFFSHKVARWLIGSAALQLLVLNVLLAGRPFFAFTLALQILFYGLAVVGRLLPGRVREWKIVCVPFYFTMVNMAALVAIIRFLAGHRLVVWDKAETTRGEPSTAGGLGPIRVLHGRTGFSQEVEEPQAGAVQTAGRR
jgi:biofilm PGA synthesis N-glycosyltransferase PgaC